MRASLLQFTMYAMMATCILFHGGNLSAATAPVQLQADDMPEKTEPNVAGVSSWEIDNEHTSVVGAVSHFGLSYVYGRFNKCSGNIEMDFQNPDASKFRFEIDSDSVDTNDVARDSQLRGSNCLDTTQYETITFESIQVKAKDVPQPDGRTKRTFLVTGNLTMRGETRKIDIPVELLAMGNGADKKLRCGFMSKFVVRRSDYGLNAMADSIGDSIAVTFCFQAVRKQEEVKEPVKVLDFDRDEESQSEMGADKKKSDLEELFRKDPVDDQGEKEKEDDDNEIEEDNMEQVLGFDRVKKSKSGTSTSSDKKNGLKDFFRKASQRWR